MKIIFTGGDYIISCLVKTPYAHFIISRFYNLKRVGFAPFLMHACCFR